jgi:hypothetical protein
MSEKGMLHVDGIGHGTSTDQHRIRKSNYLQKLALLFC